MRFSVKVILGVASCVLFITAIVASISPDVWKATLDNIRWTVICAAMAYFAWVGYQDGSVVERKYRRWFFLGTLLYFIGQIFWDILAYSSGWGYFSYASDFFYLMLGPCCLVGLLVALKTHVEKVKITAVLLDVATITISVVGLVLVFYLSHASSDHWLQMTILVLYPIVLLSAASLAILINPILKLKPNVANYLFAIGLLMLGVSWMQWNVNLSNGVLESGTTLNVIFSIADLFIGLGAMGWHYSATNNSSLISFYKRIQRSIPLAAMFFGVLALVVLFFVAAEPKEKVVALVTALCMIILAMTRQSLLLRDSELLVESNAKVVAYSEQYEQLVNYDELTGLPNRRLFQDRLEHAINMAERHQYELALLFINLDRFKSINNSLGHAEGDLLLAQVANRIQSKLRAQDTVARWGGDEFVILIERLDSRAQAAKIAKNILKLLEAPFDMPKKGSVSISASIGISLFPLDAHDHARLVRCADLATYRAKKKGRNNHQFYTSELTLQAKSKFNLDAKMRKALKLGQYELYYQPIMQHESDTGETALVGAEALIRWNISEHEVIAPNDFIFYAEDSGLIIPIGKWVFEEACRQLATWDAQGLEQLDLSINISPVQLHDPEFIEYVRRAMKDYGIAGERLTLEITEGAIMKQEDKATDLLLELKSLGVRVSIDDFGIGHSSLAKLRYLPLDELKVDRAFVKDIPDNKDDMEIASMIVGMAKGLRLGVVAEGIETQEQLAFFSKKGCERYQGYLFSRPQSAENFSKLLELKY